MIMTDERNLIKTIIVSNDWQEVLETIIVEEGMDPSNIDIMELTENFLKYIQTMEKFDFRVPARFILIAAILLRMKCELMFAKEKDKKEKKDDVPVINVDNVPLLEPPGVRVPTKPVTLNDLVSALEKAFEFSKSKEEKKVRMVQKVEELISVEKRDIESDIQLIFEKILKQTEGGKQTKITSLTERWIKEEIVKVFLPLLHLETRGKISCEQEKMFGEIYVKRKVVE